MNYILGIDPGLTGAIAYMDGFGGLLDVIDLPVIRDGTLAWIDGDALQSWLLSTFVSTGQNTRTAWIERVHAMPRQGVSSSFTFGVTFGSILGVLRARQIPIQFVPPFKWKRALGLSKDKRASLDKARLLYPNADLRLAKHEGRAEAILIAHWARTMSWQKKETAT
jgi:crossover junction endodeoxyribonuclease RuvC